MFLLSITRLILTPLATLDPTLSEHIKSDWNNALGWLADQWWVVAALVVLYLGRIVGYWVWARRGERLVHVSSVRVQGEFAQEIGPREVGLILRSQLQEIARALRGKRGGPERMPMASTVGPELGSIIGALSVKLPALDVPDTKIDPDWQIKIGGLQFPVSAVVGFLKQFLSLVPMPFRKRYQATRYQVCLVTSEGKAQVIVHRGAGRKRPVRQPAAQTTEAEGGENSTPDEPAIPGRSTITLIRSCSNLEELRELLRGAAFLILELHGVTFEGMSGRSMRHFANGLVTLDEYRRSGQKKLLTEPLQRPRDLAPELPETAEKVLFKALAKRWT